jgi:hypothetical protein
VAERLLERTSQDEAEDDDSLPSINDPEAFEGELVERR